MENARGKVLSILGKKKGKIQNTARKRQQKKEAEKVPSKPYLCIIFFLCSKHRAARNIIGSCGKVIAQPSILLQFCNLWNIKKYMARAASEGGWKILLHFCPIFLLYFSILCSPNIIMYFFLFFHIFHIPTKFSSFSSPHRGSEHTFYDILRRALQKLYSST